MEAFVVQQTNFANNKFSEFGSARFMHSKPLHRTYSISTSPATPPKPFNSSDTVLMLAAFFRSFCPLASLHSLPFVRLAFAWSALRNSAERWLGAVGLDPPRAARSDLTTEHGEMDHADAGCTLYRKEVTFQTV